LLSSAFIWAADLFRAGPLTRVGLEALIDLAGRMKAEAGGVIWRAGGADGGSQKTLRTLAQASDVGVACRPPIEVLGAVEMTADRHGGSITVTGGPLAAVARRVIEMAVTLREVPHIAREGSIGVGPNQLVLTIDLAEGVALMLTAKIPGAPMRLRSVKLEELDELDFGEPPAEPSERRILDALHGDPTPFMRREELERQWWIAEPLLEAWRSSDELPVANLAGSRGPSTTDALLAPRDAWRPI
jgi:hypothetical protein